MFTFKLNPLKDIEYIKRGFVKKRATLLIRYSTNASAIYSHSKDGNTKSIVAWARLGIPTELK